MARPFVVPASLIPYRRIGPFDRASLPVGLLAEHRLKAGTWARLTVQAGTTLFLWDDGREEPSRLIASGQTVTIPPTVPHHLEFTGDFSLSLTFLR